MFRPKPPAPRRRKKWRPDADLEAISHSELDQEFRPEESIEQNTDSLADHYASVNSYEVEDYELDNYSLETENYRGHDTESNFAELPGDLTNTQNDLQDPYLEEYEALSHDEALYRDEVIQHEVYRHDGEIQHESDLQNGVVTSGVVTGVGPTHTDLISTEPTSRGALGAAPSPDKALLTESGSVANGDLVAQPLLKPERQKKAAFWSVFSRRKKGVSGRAIQQSETKRPFTETTPKWALPPRRIEANAQAQAAELLHPTPVRWGWVVLPLFALLAAASWFALPIREVTVQGQRHLSAEQVVQRAGIAPDFGWLYYGARRAAGLTAEPWIASAVVTRQFPDHVHIDITERTPYAVWQRSEAQGGDVAVARDGTPLPDGLSKNGTVAEGNAGNMTSVENNAANLPAIQGWGPRRLDDALTLLEALRPYNVQLVKFTPSGLTVHTVEGGTAWSGDIESLLQHANAISEYPNKQLYIYPWGVSVQE